MSVVKLVAGSRSTADTSCLQSDYSESKLAQVTHNIPEEKARWPALWIVIAPTGDGGGGDTGSRSGVAGLEYEATAQTTTTQRVTARSHCHRQPHTHRDHTLLGLRDLFAITSRKKAAFM